MGDEKFLEVSRRKFLTGSIAGIAAAGIPDWFNKSEASDNEYFPKTQAKIKKFGPNDIIQIGVIGPGGSKGGYRQGLGDTKAIAGHPGVKVVAACDVDATHLAEACKTLGPDCKGYKDFRDLLARKDIDAVVIGTPDHWHTIIAIAAMQAGKDVYCEKPLTLTIGQGKKLVRVWKDTKRIFQVGSQQRSDKRFRMACELVRNGRLGKISHVDVYLGASPKSANFPTAQVPADLDWDMWLGPAFYTDYVKKRTHGDFRWWLEYSGGMITDWGAHHNDIAQWGLGTDRSGPVMIETTGTQPNLGRNCYSVFPDFDITYTYANGVTVLCTSKAKDNGIKFYGENGWIYVNRGKIEASDQALLDEPLPANAIKLYVSDDHHGNFVDCMRTRKQPICDPEIGHRSVSVCHLGNISLRLNGRKLKWDPVREEFPNDPEANQFIDRPMRAPWKI